MVGPLSVTPAESMNAWISFLATQLDPAVPFLGLLAVGEKWLDVIVGEPVATDFFLLRARANEVPVVTDIPYELARDTEAEDAKLMANLARGQLPDVSCLNGQPATANREAAAKWLMRFRPGSRIQPAGSRWRQPCRAAAATRWNARV